MPTRWFADTIIHHHSYEYHTNKPGWVKQSTWTWGFCRSTFEENMKVHQIWLTGSIPSCWTLLNFSAFEWLSGAYKAGYWTLYCFRALTSKIQLGSVYMYHLCVCRIRFSILAPLIRWCSLRLRLHWKWGRNWKSKTNNVQAQRSHIHPAAANPWRPELTQCHGVSRSKDPKPTAFWGQRKNKPSPIYQKWLVWTVPNGRLTIVN